MKNIDLNKFVPSGNRILIKEDLIPKDELTSNINYGNADATVLKTCTVIKLGDGTPMNDLGTELWKFQIHEGDKVIIPARFGTTIDINQETYILIKNTEILAYITNA